MSGIRTNAAAELLGVSPNTLRSWERRFGYPKPRRTQGGHRQYDLAELESLRRALLETHNISSAIELARESIEVGSDPCPDLPEGANGSGGLIIAHTWGGLAY